MPHPSIFILEIRILHTDPLIWRIIHMKRNMSLLDFHAAIQVAMGWKQKHHYEFVVGLPGENQYYFGVPDEESDAELRRVAIRSDEGKLTDVFTKANKRVKC